MGDLDFAEVSQLGLRLRAAKAFAPNRLDDWLHNKIGPELVKEMKKRAPVSSGALRDSIRQVNGPGQVSVGTKGIGYIQYVVEGTKPHDIKPKNGNALVFKIGNKTIFAKVVHHPGTKANNFMEEAAAAVLQNNKAWLNGLGMELIKGG